MGATAEDTGKPYPQIALNWLRHQPAMATPIIGARTPHHLEDNLGAAGWELTAEQVKRLDAVSAPPSLYPYR